MSATPTPTMRWKLLTLLLGFVPAVLFGLVAGWFVHKLIDLGQVPWQALVKGLVILVVLLVLAALVARALFRLALPRMLAGLSASWERAALRVRKTPAVLTDPAFWLDEVWPAACEAKSLIFAWIGVYSTMAAVVALAALLCQTGTLAVAYLQIQRLDIQNDKLEQQTKLLNRQTDATEQQSTLLEKQNTLLSEQNLLSESARRAALLQIVGDVLAAIDTETKVTDPEEVTGIRNQPGIGGGSAQITHTADKRRYRTASPRLLGRLAAACSSLRGYRYLGDDGKPVASPRSPERGFVLRSLVAAGIDITTLIDQRADFSYAEAENAMMEYFRMEPTPLAASSVSGERGLKLTDSQLEGISFRGARLGDANFKRASLDNASFAGARLCNASFEQAGARGTKFVDADLRDAWMTGADLTAADFSTNGALGDTIMPAAAAFRMADVTEIDLAGAFVNREDWLDVLAKECRPGDNAPTFSRESWKLIPADREANVRHQQDEIQTEDLKTYRWRIANADGTLQSSGQHGGTVITPRYDRHTPAPSPPKRK